MADRRGPRILMAVEQLRRAVPGGIGAYARGLLRGLTECSEDGALVDVTLLASRRPGHLLGRSLSDDDPLSRFGRPLVLSHLPGPVLTRCWDHGWWRVPAGYDIVHSISLASPPHRHGATAHSVVTVHDVAWRRFPEATTARGRKWHNAALTRARDSGASLVVTSNLVSADLVDFGVDPARITIVHGGSDHLVPEDSAAADELLHRLGVDGEFLLTVSTLEPRKNVGRLVEAFRRVRGELPERWHLVIVGPTGWGPALPSPDEQEGVVLAGAVSDAVLSGLYRRARAFAYVPLTEGYGLPPLEAMRSGTPTVVSHEVPSVHDLGQLGPPPARLVDPLDIDDVAGGILTVLTDEEVRRHLSGRGEAYARARTWRAAAQEHIELWNALR